LNAGLRSGAKAYCADNESVGGVTICEISAPYVDMNKYMGAIVQTSISHLCFLLSVFENGATLLACINNLNGCSYNTLENK
jgi:hypothetical protein